MNATTPHNALPETVLAVFPFLDLWRVIAAGCVLALHFQQQGYWSAGTPSFFRLAHLGVIVFFVISGFSVASAAHRGGYLPLAFLVARWSRLYSIVVPALLLALVLDELADVNRSDLYPTWQYRKWWLHLGFHLLFLGESWQYTLRPFSIIPYWSLAYEFWFYALLAATMLRDRLWRALALTLVLMIMGPHLWLLLPCWLLGVAAFHLQVRAGPATDAPSASDRGLVTRLLASAGFIAALAWCLSSGLDARLMAVSQQIDQTVQSLSGKTLRLDYARWFLADYLIAILFAGTLLLVASQAKGAPGKQPGALGRALAWLAPHTFGIYLLHYTLIEFSAATIPLAQRSGWRSPLLAGFIVLVCILLSVLFSRSRPFWQHVLTRIVNWGPRAGRI